MIYSKKNNYSALFPVYQLGNITLILIFAFLFLGITDTYGQLNKRTDPEINYSKDTTGLHKLIKTASDSMEIGQLDVAMRIARSAHALAESAHYLLGTGVCLNLKGKISYRRANFDSAIYFSKKALIIGQQLSDSTLLSGVYLNLGNSNYTKGNDIMASAYYFRGLAIEEKRAVKQNLFAFLNNIGGIFCDQKNPRKGLEYYLKSLQLAEKTKNYKRLGTIYHNIGSTYLNIGDLKNARLFFEKSYANAKLMNDMYVMNLYPGNMSEVYCQLKQYDNAYLYAVKSLKILHDQGFKDQVTTTLMTIADIQINRGLYREAERYLKNALILSKEIDTKKVTKDIYHRLADLYEKQGEFENAYTYYTLFSNTKDSMLNQENSKLLIEMNTKYTTEKKEKEIELLKKNEDIQTLELSKKENELGRQQTVNISISVGLLLVMIAAILLFSGYRLKKKANEKLQEAYEVIEEKNKIIEKSNAQITDSIFYAKRIQDAVLPSDEDLEGLFPGNHFVFFQPSQIVSGDFYWCSQQNGKIIIAVADCTGHGVPGAFMSMIGNTLLNEIVNEQKITCTKQIAELLDKKIIHALRQNEGSGKYDGMDISICSIDKTNSEITFTGAHHIMYAFGDKLQKIKGDSYSIGGAQQLNSKLFTSQTIEYKGSVNLYFLTDGYIDQSGGSENKRFSYKRFETLLTEIKYLSLVFQKEKLKQTFENWRSNTKQRDDVLVIGIKC